MNEEILKKLGYNSIALEMLLKREAQINPEDILMPGERPNINRDNSFDDLHSDTVTGFCAIGELLHLAAQYAGPIGARLVYVPVL